MHSLRRPGLNCREIRFMHENTLQTAKCYFLQWTLSAVKVTFGKCLLPVHWDRTHQSLPVGCNRDEDGWLSLKVYIFLKWKCFQIPWSFTSCSSGFTCVQNTFSFYFHNGSEQLVVTVQNSITYNSVDRSICRRDVPWIHLEKTQFSNLTLLIIHIYICQFYWSWSSLFSSGIF